MKRRSVLQIAATVLALSISAGQSPGAGFSFDLATEGADFEILAKSAGNNLGQGTAADLNGDGADELIVWGASDYAGDGAARLDC